MAEGEEKTDRYRASMIPHELSRDVIDRRDVIGIDGVPQSQPVDHQHQRQ